jgi:hypothetical protein
MAADEVRPEHGLRILLLVREEEKRFVEGNRTVILRD